MLLTGCATQREVCQPKIDAARLSVDQEWRADAKQRNEQISSSIHATCAVGGAVLPLGKVVKAGCTAVGKQLASTFKPNALDPDEINERVKAKVAPECRAYL
ncbi:hypothetical protein HNQ01_001598 [Leptothrix sp. C29]|uniref:Lipoprotein n=1 Tax=Sphaerotilus uruguayifluvii TaxID=2735897 RepID=A0ABX2G342_9BURK|nr:hypothetical protein [Leptothrix sp. C29]